MKKLLVVLAAAFATAAIAVTPAFATGGTATWNGQGSQNLPCEGNEHWVLSNSKDVTGAELWVDGTDMGAFSQSGQGSWSIDTNFGFDGTQSVSAVWTGEGSPQLVLSHCDTATSTTGTTTTTTGTTGTTGETTGTTGETTGTTGETTGTTGETSGGTTGTSGGTTGGTTAGDVSGSTTGGTTGGTAATPSGGNLPFTGLPVWIPLLAAAAMLASGVFLVRRRKGELS
jgi:hypothetical protein